MIDYSKIYDKASNTLYDQLLELVPVASRGKAEKLLKEIMNESIAYKEYSEELQEELKQIIRENTSIWKGGSGQ
jgi:hypothetical protein